jgi:hypothetical protein
VARGALIRTIVAMSAIAVFPAVSYSARASKPRWLCSAHASSCATLIIHAYRATGGCFLEGEQPCVDPEKVVPATRPLRIEKRGPPPRGKVLSSWVTEEHELRVVPGRYRVYVIRRAGFSAPASNTPTVTVSAGQTLEITLGLIRH